MKGLKKGRDAFTLLEILTIVAIVAVLAALLMAGSNGVLAKANGTKCLSNLRQMGGAAMQYAIEHNGDLPPAYMPTSATDSLIFYRVLNQYLGPYDQNVDISKYPKIYRCPSDPNPFLSGIASYGCNQYLSSTVSRPSAANIYDSSIKRSQVILYVDAVVASINPSAGSLAGKISFRHDHFCNAVMMDGSACASFSERGDLLATPVSKSWGAN